MESSFDNFWNLYDNKKSRDKCERKWFSLSAKDQQACMDSLPKYIASTTERQYRKHPATYLNNKCWNDKIYGKEDEAPLKVVWNKPTEVSKEPAKYFNPEEGKSYIIGKIKKAYETGSRLNDYGSVYTKRLAPFLNTPEDVLSKIQGEVLAESLVKPKNRFEEKVEINLELEIRNRVLRYNMNQWRKEGNKIWEKL